MNPELMLADASISILEGVILPWGEPGGYLRRSVIPGLAEAYEFDPNTPWADLDGEARLAILYGSGKMKIRFPYRTAKWDAHYEDVWEGVVTNVERRYKETKSEQVRTQLGEYMSTLPCTACSGSRLRPESLAVTVGGRSLGDLVDLSIEGALELAGSLVLSGDRAKASAAPGGHLLPAEVAGPILKEVTERLGFLINVGLGYLTLGRSAELLRAIDDDR